MKLIPKYPVRAAKGEHYTISTRYHLRIAVKYCSQIFYVNQLTYIKKYAILFKTI